jgi:hypothetical protein
VGEEEVVDVVGQLRRGTGTQFRRRVGSAPVHQEGGHGAPGSPVGGIDVPGDHPSGVALSLAGLEQVCQPGQDEVEAGLGRVDGIDE